MARLASVEECNPALLGLQNVNKPAKSAESLHQVEL